MPELVEPLTLRGDVVADGGYFGRAVTEAIQALGATARIPSQRNVRVVRSVDRDSYRCRNLIERFFNRLKNSRGIATRYFKTAVNFLSPIHLAAARLWIRAYESSGNLWPLPSELKDGPHFWLSKAEGRKQP